MARKVTFKLTDGMKPRKLESVGKPFAIRTPIPLNLIPNTSPKLVKLGVTCELPLMLVTKDGIALFAPGQELSVTLKTGPDENINLSEGETVAKAYVIDNTYFELADA